MFLTEIKVKIYILLFKVDANLGVSNYMSGFIKINKKGLFSTLVLLLSFDSLKLTIFKGFMQFCYET